MLVSVKYKCPLRTLRECEYTRTKLRRNKCGAYSERQAPPLVGEET
jgi:hypothetical protein